MARPPPGRLAAVGRRRAAYKADFPEEGAYEGWRADYARMSPLREEHYPFWATKLGSVTSKQVEHILDAIIAAETGIPDDTKTASAN